jgi:hypothetical protein
MEENAYDLTSSELYEEENHSDSSSEFSETRPKENIDRNEQENLQLEANTFINNDLLHELVNKLQRPGRRYLLDEDMSFLLELYLKSLGRAKSSLNAEITPYAICVVLVSLLAVFNIFLAIPVLFFVFYNKVIMFILSLIFSRFLIQVDEFLSRSEQMAKNLNQREKASSFEDDLYFDSYNEIDIKDRKELFLRLREVFFSLKKLNSTIIDRFDLGNLKDRMINANKKVLIKN